MHNSICVIPVKTGIQEILENTGYTLKGNMADLRREDKSDGFLWLRSVPLKSNNINQARIKSLDISLEIVYWLNHWTNQSQEKNGLEGDVP
ncbi:MAG: hypothetical protein CVU62_06900 [Deltaproteobacteria bacterium HGW-Deltaproteobacteria-2]|nr:MAG: hypothetical protein CVU62_06900 [Deltaproteobacteria bacterium HGW-Deltaproteobacteria-2]